MSIVKFITKYTTLWVILGAAVAFMIPGPFKGFGSWIPFLLGIIMLGMGLSMTPGDFKLVFSPGSDNRPDSARLFLHRYNLQRHDLSGQRGQSSDGHCFQSQYHGRPNRYTSIINVLRWQIYAHRCGRTVHEHHKSRHHSHCTGISDTQSLCQSDEHYHHRHPHRFSTFCCFYYLYRCLAERRTPQQRSRSCVCCLHAIHISGDAHRLWRITYTPHEYR